MHRIDPKYTHTLADGYLLRWATSADADAYAALAEKSFVISHLGINNPNVGLYARDMCSGQHPLCQPNDIAVVCAPDGRMVAAAALQHQPLQYAGITLSVGRPELVCSDPDVRQRGFVREIMHLLHHKSALRGDVMQAITGIPNYYHQFGYVWSIDYNAYARIAFTDIPASDMLLSIRRARPDEYDTFFALYDNERTQRQVLMSTPFSQAYYQHGLTTTCSREQHVPHFICDENAQIIGFILLLPYGDEDGGVCVTGLGFADSHAPQTWFVPTMHALRRFVPQLAKPHPAYPDTTHVFVQLDGQPQWQALLQYHSIKYRYEAPYTWYIRVADFAKLLWQVRTALETRLAQSALRGYTGNLVIWFFRDGIELTWQHGTLISITPWQKPDYGESHHATYPPGILAQQLFGWRSYHELHAWRPDVWVQPPMIPLMDTLFPAQHSWFLWCN